jgi:AcrR family transcriptional regulator
VAETTRQRILREATRQLTAQGYSAFTIAAVRDALGLSSGSMFHAFPSKPALAAAVFVEGMVDYQHAALAALAASDGGEGSVRALVRNHLAWIEDHRDLARVLFSTLPDDVMAEAAAPLAAHNGRFYAALDRFYEELAAAGRMARLPRALAHSICIGPAHEYGRQWVRGDAAARPRAVSTTLQDAAVAALAATLARSRSVGRRTRRTPP